MLEGFCITVYYQSKENNYNTMIENCNYGWINLLVAIWYDSLDYEYNKSILWDFSIWNWGRISSVCRRLDNSNNAGSMTEVSWFWGSGLGVWEKDVVLGEFKDLGGY